MEPDNRSTRLPTSSEGAAPDDVRARSWVEPDQLWDEHGAALLTMAWTVLGDESEALLAVTLGLMDVYDQASPELTLPSAARCVYRHCHRPAPPAAGLAAANQSAAMVGLREISWSQRSALALCFFGGLTYREAATELGIPAEVAAGLLLSALQELGRMGTEAARWPVD